MSNITRLFDFPYHQLEKYNIPDALVTKQNGTWIKTSTEEYLAKANTISRALIKLGIQKNDKIAIISSNNRTEWHIMDIGILQTGAQTVPIYPTISEVDYEYIFNHSEATYCFVSDEDVFKKVKSIRNNLPKLKEVYCFNEVEGCKNWNELLELGKDTSNQDVVEDRKNSVKTDDLASIIYTSGTTGKPKGVMLSHKNIVSNVLDSANRIPFEEGKSRALSFLPICHIYERMVTYIYQFYGCAIYFGESLEKISDNIKEVQPSVMTGVPRLIEKVYEKIIAKGSELTGIKKALFFWAVKIGTRYEPYGVNGFWYETQLKLARKLIFSKWKAGLGGNLDLIVNGSAALQPRLARVFAAAEINIMEGYGLTETSPVISVNDMRNHGYYKDEALTNEVIVDGYFHTGDIGQIDKDGFLKITDRKKEMFKTSGGKYIAPQLLENAMKQCRFIGQIMVIGEGEKMPAALIQLNFDFVKEWAKIHNIDIGATDQEIVKNAKVIDRLKEEIDRLNQKFGNWEQIKQFELTPDIWSVEGGHLTPTLKLKRKVILQNYKDLYAKIYGEKE